jgi:hypothetical protein
MMNVSRSRVDVWRRVTAIAALAGCFSIALSTTAAAQHACFAYVANNNPSVSTYSLDTAGSLTEVTTVGLLPGSSAFTFAMTPSQSFLYVGDNFGMGISGFAIDAATGALTALAGSPFPFPYAQAMVVDPSRRFLLVAHGGSVKTYGIDSTTGGIQFVDEFVGGTPSSLTIDPSGQYVYVANVNANTVSGFTLDRNSGRSSAVPGSPFVAGLVAQTPPMRNAALRAVWTPASDAPKNLLTALEGRHHDLFVERARAGNIDLVFFGATDTEMWSWPDSILGGVDRGKRVWDQAFGSLNAANFGSQGTHAESLLWRMQNGELDGYEAKLVVLHAVGVKGTSGGQPIGNIGDQPIGDRQAEFVAGYGRVIAEIRARQPQAKILILPPFPRGRLRREEWRTVADANAVAYRRLADDSTVFYANFGDRFFLPDGSHNQEMWTIPGPPNAGMHEPGFKVWAEELQPWLDRFIR